MYKKTIVLSILLVIIVLSGCNSEDDNRIVRKDSDENITKINKQTHIEQAITNKAKEIIQSKSEVTGVRGVNTNKDLLLAIEVTQIEQFNEQNLEDEVAKSLEKNYPDLTIEVSSDKKIFIELNELELKIQEDKVNKKELEDQFNKIKKLMNEQA
ncbi:hypothetical protein [Aquibacillus rhizosphaerae]|uniref:Sporulation protein n=1 Tax=Aquibacillus rhizosphaerae TaxID=3051431 RepID=A0ABT7L8I4_9BACI|nr:hypothetical protein [Aquibacillus sp. LR5S19]MDL4842178.1 hypothetical protein [Aquibacillus sp. LR5S19]